jgi:hypothetical protein
VKTASHVASVKNVYVNCASHWTPLRPLLLPLSLPPLKSVRPVSRVKNALRALRVKSVNRAPNKPLPSLKKKCSATKSNWQKTVRKAPKAIVHVVAPAASVVAAIVVSVNVMPTAT